MTRILPIVVLLPFLAPILTGCADDESVTLNFEDTNSFCTVVDNTVVCPDGSELTLEPIEGATIASIIYPCEDTSNNQEILLRLSDGSILGIFDGDTSSNPGQTRLVELAPGNYVTTDQRNNSNRCRFTITNDGEVNPSLEVQL